MKDKILDWAEKKPFWAFLVAAGIAVVISWVLGLVFE